MTCYHANYLHWRSQCCYHCCLPQRYQRSQIWGWVIWENINLFAHLLFPISQRLDVGGGCRRGRKPQLNLKFYNFSGDSKLCVCKEIHSYFETHNVWGIGESQFLVSHIKPHKPVSPSTVSRWLGQVLAMAGINTEVFKVHSTRSASSSKGEVTGVSLTDN